MLLKEKFIALIHEKLYFFHRSFCLSAHPVISFNVSFVNKYKRNI